MTDIRNAAIVALGLAAVALGGLALWQRGEIAQAHAAHTTTRLTHAETLRGLAELTTTAYKAALEDDARRTAQLRKVAEDGQIQIDAARDDAAGAQRAADGLRGQLAAYVAAVRAAAGAAAPAVADAGPPAAEAVVVLADLFGRADSRAGDLAAAFDASHARGTTCERAADALTP